MSTANRVIKNTGWLYAKMAITMFVSLYTTRLILNGLGAADFGIFNIVGGAISMLGFLNAAMASATQRFMSYSEGEGNKEKQKYIFNISVVLHASISAIIALILIFAGYFFFNGLLNIPCERIDAAKVVYASLIVSTVLTVINVPYDAVMNAHENMKYYALIGIFESLLKLSIAFACVYTTYDKLIVYAILMACIPIVTLTIMKVYCHRHYAECVINPVKYWDKRLIKEMTAFGGWGLISTSSAYLTMQGMNILLNMFGGVIVNAAHAVANQLAGQLMAFSNNMIKALNPVLVKRCGSGDNKKMLEAALTGNKMSFLIFSFFAVPFIVEAPTILRLWLKEVPEWSVLFVRLVFIRQMISQLFVTLETCISATGRIKNTTIINSIIWIFPLVTGYIMYKAGAPIYTIYILLIIMNFMRMSNSLYFCKKMCQLEISDYARSVMLPCFAQTLVLFGVLISLCALMESGICSMSIVLAISFIRYRRLDRTVNCLNLSV
ncbi:MAG: MATE family efflux transporter, partial [Bacteroides sp.]